MFIVELIYTKPLEEVDKYLEEHRAYLRKQYENKNFIASGRQNPRTGGVILSKMKSLDELKAVLKEDPFNKAGLAEYRIIEFDPAMTAEGFEILKG